MNVTLRQSARGRRMSLPVLAAAVFCASASVALAQGAKPAAKPAPAPAAAPIKLKLDAEACRTFDFGAIMCGEEYQARLTKDRKSWSVTGPRITGERSTTVEYPVSAEKDTIVLWGLPLKRNKDVLFFNEVAVGKVMTPPKPAGTAKTKTN